MTSFVFYFFSDEDTFKLSGNIVGGLPSLSLPFYGINVTSDGTEIPEDEITPNDILGGLGTVFATLPLVAILCQMAIGKAWCKCILRILVLVIPGRLRLIV